MIWQIREGNAMISELRLLTKGFVLRILSHIHVIFKMISRDGYVSWVVAQFKPEL